MNTQQTTAGRTEDDCIYSEDFIKFGWVAYAKLNPYDVGDYDVVEFDGVLPCEDFFFDHLRGCTWVPEQAYELVEQQIAAWINQDKKCELEDGRDCALPVFRNGSVLIIEIWTHRNQLHVGIEPYVPRQEDYFKMKWLLPSAGQAVSLSETPKQRPEPQVRRSLKRRKFSKYFPRFFLAAAFVLFLLSLTKLLYTPLVS